MLPILKELFGENNTPYRHFLNDVYVQEKVQREGTTRNTDEARNRSEEWLKSQDVRLVVNILNMWLHKNKICIILNPRYYKSVFPVYTAGIETDIAEYEDNEAIYEDYWEAITHSIREGITIYQKKYVEKIRGY